MTTIVAQPFNVIKWQLKYNPVAYKIHYAHTHIDFYVQKQ
jgi:hypothetical protein